MNVQLKTTFDRNPLSGLQRVETKKQTFRQRNNELINVEENCVESYLQIIYFE